MIIEQILVTSMAVFCFLIADIDTKEAVLIDPAGDYDKIFKVIEKHNLKLKYIINTHGHFDHTSGNHEIIKRTGAELFIHKDDAKKLGNFFNSLFAKILVGGKGSPKADKLLNDGDVIKLGSIELKIIHTPGHSPGGICIYTDGNVFTGDTLFTEGYGRYDLPGGSYEKLMDSIINKILTLPDDTIIWPGHNYGKSLKSTVKEQKLLYLD